MTTPITADAINDLRRRVLNNEAYTKEELANAIKVLIGDRVAASQATAVASKKRPSRTVSLDAFLPPKA